MSNDSEEKVLPPTEHKLKKIREKGQVASSDDFVTGLSITLGIIYLVFNWHSFFEVSARLLDLSVMSITASTPQRGLAVFLTLVIEVGYLLTPLFILLILTGIAANILYKRGIPFSLHPIKPDFNKISPASGLKKLFSRRNATEFGISFVKITIWFSLAGVFIWLLLQPVLASLHCSLGCVLESANELGLLIIVCALVMLVFAGLLDMPMQNFLFRHEQKMGHKEMKYELKDIYGAHEFKNHRRRQHQDMVSGGGGSDGDHGTGQVSDGADGMTLIIRGFDSAVGLYFHPKHCDVPRVVKKFTGNSLVRNMQQAEQAKIPILNDANLARELQKTIDTNGFIKAKHFERVAQMLIQINAI